MGSEGGQEVEVEATLVVASPSPGEVLAGIAGVDALGGYAVRWTDDRPLRDVYVDTPSRALRSAGLALRLREDGSGWRVTLKGEGRPDGAGAVERTEIEGAWAPAAVERILGELEARGVRLPRPPELDTGGEPPEALRSAGLETIQDRRSRRRRARLVEREGGGTAAWLVLDTVRFRVRSGARVAHREVEVEATAGAPPGLPGRLAAELRSRLPDVLRPWPHPKLATGLALEGTDPPTSDGGDLLPEAYERLERELGEG